MACRPRNIACPFALSIRARYFPSVFACPASNHTFCPREARELIGRSSFAWRGSSEDGCRCGSLAKLEELYLRCAGCQVGARTSDPWRAWKKSQRSGRRWRTEIVDEADARTSNSTRRDCKSVDRSGVGSSGNFKEQNSIDPERS